MYQGKSCVVIFHTSFRSVWVGLPAGLRFMFSERLTVSFLLFTDKYSWRAICFWPWNSQSADSCVADFWNSSTSPVRWIIIGQCYHLVKTITLPSHSNCWFSHDVTKFQASELLILQRFYFHDVLEQLKTNIQTNFHSEWVLGLVIDYAWISKLLRDVAITWRTEELLCWFKRWLISGNSAIWTVLVLE